MKKITKVIAICVIAQLLQITLLQHCRAHTIDSAEIDKTKKFIDSAFLRREAPPSCQRDLNSSFSQISSNQTRLQELQPNKVRVDEGSVLFQTRSSLEVLTKNANLKIPTDSAVLVNVSEKCEEILCLSSSRHVHVNFAVDSIDLSSSEAVTLSMGKVSPSDELGKHAFLLYGRILSKGEYAAIGHFGLVRALLDEPVLAFVWRSNLQSDKGFKDCIATELLREDPKKVVSKRQKFRKRHP